MEREFTKSGPRGGASSNVYMVDFHVIKALKYTLNGNPVKVSRAGVKDAPEDSLYLSPNGYRAKDANHFVWDEGTGSYVLEGDWVFSFIDEDGDYEYFIHAGGSQNLIGGDPEKWSTPNMEYPFIDSNRLTNISYYKDNDNLYDKPWFRSQPDNLWSGNQIVGNYKNCSIDSSKCETISTSTNFFNPLGDGVFEAAYITTNQ